MKALATVVRARCSGLDWAEASRVLRFAGNGVFNTLLSYLLFVLLLLTGLPGTACLLLASGLTILVNFFTSKTLVFRSTQEGRMPRFLLLYGTLLAFNAVALRGLCAVGLPAWCAQALLALPIAAAGYLLQRNLVFAQRDRSPPQGDPA